MTETDDRRTDWPARAYVYGTWGYALNQARERAAQHGQRMWLYRGVLDGERVWVVAWDPKPAHVVDMVSRPEAERYAVHAGWLVELVDHHTCGAGDVYGHEPGCGMVPVARLDSLLAAEAALRLHLRAALDAGRDQGGERA